MSDHFLAIYEKGKIAPFIISTRDWDMFLWNYGLGPQYSYGLKERLDSGEWSVYRDFGKMEIEQAEDVMPIMQYDILREFPSSAYTSSGLLDRHSKTPFDSAKSLYGYASPDGIYFVCGYEGHSGMASVIVAKELPYDEYDDLMGSVKVDQDAPLILNYVCITGDGLILINPKNDNYCLSISQVEVLNSVADIAKQIGTEFSIRFSENLRRRIDLYQIKTKGRVG